MRQIDSLVKDAELVRRKRGEIGDAAYRVFASKGFHQSSMREIAEAAGVGVGSIYTYIRAKEDLLDLVYERTMTSALAETRAAVEGIADPEARLEALLRVNLEVVHRHQDFFLLMYQESAAMQKESLRHVFAVENEYVDIYEQVLADGIRQGAFRVANVHVAAVSIAFLCSVWALKRWNLRQHSLQDCVASLSELVLKGVKR